MVPTRIPSPDFNIENHGSIFLVIPRSDAAREWVAEYLPVEMTTFGNGVAVEPRYVRDIVDGILKAGLTAS